MPGIVAITLVTLATLTIGTVGLRVSRTTSDFFVASRTVKPGLNASAIGGEYLSAASFLGVAGLVLTTGAEMLWYPIGWTAGYLVLLVLVAAPLRRSGAYTLPDFAEARLGSRGVRTLCSLLVVAVGWLYLYPQLQGAGVTLHAIVGAPSWLGPLLVTLVVLANVTSGGMRSVTFVQAFQYWLKLTALLLPAAVLLVVWLGDGRPSPRAGESWSVPLAGGGAQGLYTTYSLILATFLGTMGLPHVGVRFYTNPDGRAARRTTVVVLALLGAFYLLPPVFGALGRAYGASPATADTLVLELPRLMLDGLPGEVLTGLVAAGAFAAFLSTSSGLTVAVAGVLSQDVVTPAVRRLGTAPPAGAAGTEDHATDRSGRRLRIGGVAAFRIAAVAAVTVPFVAALVVPHVGVARAVGLAFAVAASTFCPLLLLGIWWRGLTPAGATAGLVAGFLGSGASVVWTLAGRTGAGWSAALLAQPAAWSVPVAVATMVLVSLATADTVPPHTHRLLVRLHSPEPQVADQPRA